MIFADVTERLHGTSGPFELSVKLELEERKTYALFGCSGSGKTTFLRILAGLVEPDSGRVEAFGELWHAPARGIRVPSEKRGVGFVFQDYALFPHLTVRGNVAYSCRDHALVDVWIKRTGLSELAGKKPSRLSGGQKQRVALARALASSPRLLLLDEPLSALDSTMRVRLQDVIATYRAETGATIILASHDLPEVFRLADEVLVLEEGKIIRKGTPREVFLPRDVSSKFSVTGQILAIDKAGVLSVAWVGFGGSAAQIVLTDADREYLSVGDDVLVASKAFQAILWQTVRRNS
jgi:molybdate transport system ATP-binding protein